MSILIANTKYGKILGSELHGKYEGITTFRSVPYAQPPVGELRFRSPVDPVSWMGVLDATMFASRPMTSSMVNALNREPYGSDFYYKGNPSMSEDCLYLHITTGAADPSERRPVFIWFHGGGLISGYYSELEFDPSELARKGIVVVSVGQRLNVFGYLCLPQLSEEQGGISGNYGLMDEIKALEWVRENIEAFGGDPDNITVGGQSGGTAKSTALATCPQAAGKIRRCINQSNLSWAAKSYETLDAAYENCRAYLKNIGLDENITVEELRKVPAQSFFNQKEQVFFGPGGLPNSMVCDGKYVMSISGQKNMEDYAGDIDFLSGGNEGEMSINGAALMNMGEKFETAKEFYGFMRSKLGNLFAKYNFEKIYPVTDDNAQTMGRVLAARGLSDGFLNGGVIQNRYFGAYRAVHAPRAHTYSYTFGRYLPSRPEEAGTVRDSREQMAWHSGELWYTFGSLLTGEPTCRVWEPLDVQLAEQLSSYWANFIATGNPNGQDSLGNILPYWPESRENYGWMYVTNEGIEGREGLDELDRLCLEYHKINGNVPEL